MMTSFIRLLGLLTGTILCSVIHHNDAFVPNTAFVWKSCYKVVDSRIEVRSTIQQAQGSKTTDEPYDAATKILDILIGRRKEDIGETAKVSQQMREEQNGQIEALIDTIRRSDDVYYNPESSLFGVFFSSLYWYTPNDPDADEPLWERLSFKSQNIKGQQYYYMKQDDEGENKSNVINYSEVWGSQVRITADGYLERLSSRNGKEKNDNASSSSSSSSSSFVEKLIDVGRTVTKFGSNNKNNNKDNKNMIRCPDAYRINATGGTLSILGQSVPLPIEGSSTLVILYADPRIRVFLSPVESNSALGNWENAGLVVVQVRSDLVPGIKQGDVPDLR